MVKKTGTLVIVLDMFVENYISAPNLRNKHTNLDVFDSYLHIDDQHNFSNLKKNNKSNIFSYHIIKLNTF